MLWKVGTLRKNATFIDTLLTGSNCKYAGGLTTWDDWQIQRKILL